MPFRSKVSFGKRIEFMMFSKLLLDPNKDVYIPTVDDHGVDCIVKCTSGAIHEIQIKAISKGSLFAAINHPTTPIPNFWFIFYSEMTGKTWLLSSADFIAHCSRNATGRNVGKCSISLGPSLNKFLVSDFSRIK